MMMEKQPFAITLSIGSLLANGADSWRTERPVYANLLPPRNKACSVRENIQQWFYHAEEGNYQAAWCEIMVDNPMSVTMGRVCYHLCQDACNRVQVDRAVGINATERSLGDKATEQGWRVPVLAPGPGKSVLIVGAGPSGLSTTCHPRLTGHHVHIKETGPIAEGTMRFDIPSYRLSRGIFDAEIHRIEEMGVPIEYGAKVENVEDKPGKRDAIFPAVGVHIGRRTDIPANESAKIANAVSLLQGVKKGRSPMLGRGVVVYGDGSTMTDVARTTKHLGTLEAIIVYRRTRDRMPAYDSEVAEAEEEGIMMRRLSTVKHVDGGTLTIEKMELDDLSFPQSTGEFEELGTDSLIMTLGQEADLSLIENVSSTEVEDRAVKVSNQMVTGIEGVLASGDMVPSGRMATVTIDHKKEASRYTDTYLHGMTYTPAPKHADAEFSRMTPWRYAGAPRQVHAKPEGARRVPAFDEVVQGLDEELALFEAHRYVSCGNCFGCNNCFGVCPDSAIVKIAPDEYELGYDYCKGCGLCVGEYPCGAISTVPKQV